MENLFNHPILIKLQEFGQKLGSNKFLSSLQAAMMSLMGIIMVGAISQIATAVGSSMLNLFTPNSAMYRIFYMPYEFTMNHLSLWVVVFFAYNYAQKLKMKSPIMNAVNALVCFLLVAAPISMTSAGLSVLDRTYLGAQGMFVGFMVFFIAVQIEKFCIDKNIRIKMPDVVPPYIIFSAVSYCQSPSVILGKSHCGLVSTLQSL